jgi:hypothetical protein
MKLSQKKTRSAKHVLVYGPPKSGKTELVGKLAEKYNLIIFDLEGGVTTLMKLSEEWQDRIEVASIPDTRGNPMAIKTMLQVIKGNAGTVCEEHGAWNCATCKVGNKPVIHVHLNALGSDTIVVVDSITQLTNSAIAHITSGTDDLYKLQFDDWGNLGKLMDMFLSYVQNAPYHVVCITHENEVEMVDGKNKIVPVAGSSKFSRNTAKYFDEVIYCEVKLGKHIAASGTTYNASILTGSRTGHFLEKSTGTPSLLPIFDGTVPTSGNPAAENATGAPGQNAVSNLAALREKMKGGTAA